MAKLSTLELRLLPSGAIEAALLRLSESLLCLSPQVASCMHPHGAVVLVDAQGLLVHEGKAREKALAEAMLALATSLGHHGRVAVADGPWAAAALARFGKTAGFFRKNRVFHAPVGESSPLLSKLPLAALDLGETHETGLAGLGLRTVGDLSRAPRGELTVRLGGEARRVLERLSGIDAEPLPALVLPEVPREAHTFEEGCEHLEPMLFALRGLTSRLAARLFGRGMAARALVIGLSGSWSPGENGEGGRSRGDSPADEETLRLELPSPLHRAEALFAVVKARLERHQAQGPVRSLALTAELLAPREARSEELFGPRLRGEAALPQVLGELEAHHGSDRVGFLQVVEAWRPEDRSRLLPARARPNGTFAPRVPESFPLLQPLEPLRVFPRAVPIEPLEPIASYMHIEATEWWRYGEESLVLEVAKGGDGVVALIERAASSEEASHGDGQGASQPTSAPICSENADTRTMHSMMRLWGWFG